MSEENKEPKKANTQEQKSDDGSRSPGTDRSPSSSDTSDDSRSPGTDRSPSSSDTSDDSDDNSRSPGTDRRE